MRYYQFSISGVAENIKALIQDKEYLREYRWENPISAVNRYMYYNLKNHLGFFAYRQESTDKILAVLCFDEKREVLETVYAYIIDVLERVFEIKRMPLIPSEITMYEFMDCLKEARRRRVEPPERVFVELSNLFTYLLWNGYLSKTKQHVYRIEDRKMIIGLAFADIMDGVGVCLNHADMLKDFLNTCGYNSSTMINLVDKNIKSNYKFDIERKSEKAKKKTEILNLAMCPIMKKIGNHAFTLIEDNNKLYIYDSTNLMLLNVINPYEA